jgi:putative GTP pyrophosphokinase
MMLAELEESFDLRQHAQAAVSAYLERRTFFEELAQVVRRILEALKRRDIKVLSVQARAKDPTSLGKKAALPSDEDPNRPRYGNPLKDITDLAGVRVIAFFPGTLSEIDTVLEDQFMIVERSNKGDDLIEEERFGYQSIHYLVSLDPRRSKLPEYEPFADAIAEIQVRTILQHAWAEIEHDIQYKSSSVIPTEIRRRFMALAGMLEIADREFQTIQDDDRRLTAEARSRVELGQLERVEITPDAVKAFLDQRLGSDGRMSDSSYDWTARLLRKLGFRTLQQVDACIHGLDDDVISRAVAGGRQGQITRFEYTLMVGMGQHYLRKHPFAPYSWWDGPGRYAKLRERGIVAREYDPSTDSGSSVSVPEAAPSNIAFQQPDG